LVAVGFHPSPRAVPRPHFQCAAALCFPNSPTALRRRTAAAMTNYTRPSGQRAEVHERVMPCPQRFVWEVRHSLMAADVARQLAARCLFQRNNAMPLVSCRGLAVSSELCPLSCLLISAPRARKARRSKQRLLVQSRGGENRARSHTCPSVLSIVDGIFALATRGRCFGGGILGRGGPGT
jgi:hypothetical protein